MQLSVRSSFFSLQLRNLVSRIQAYGRLLESLKHLLSPPGALVKKSHLHQAQRDEFRSWSGLCICYDEASTLLMKLPCKSLIIDCQVVCGLRRSFTTSDITSSTDSPNPSLLGLVMTLVTGRSNSFGFEKSTTRASISISFETFSGTSIATPSPTCSCTVILQVRFPRSHFRSCLVLSRSTVLMKDINQGRNRIKCL